MMLQLHSHRSPLTNPPSPTAPKSTPTKPHLEPKSTDFTNPTQLPPFQPTHHPKTGTTEPKSANSANILNPNQLLAEPFKQ